MQYSEYSVILLTIRKRNRRVNKKHGILERSGKLLLCVVSYHVAFSEFLLYTTFKHTLFGIMLTKRILPLTDSGHRALLKAHTLSLSY